MREKVLKCRNWIVNIAQIAIELSGNYILRKWKQLKFIRYLNVYWFLVIIIEQFTYYSIILVMI